MDEEEDKTCDLGESFLTEGATLQPEEIKTFISLWMECDEHPTCAEDCTF